MGLLGGKSKYIDKGVISEEKVITRCIQCGYNVLRPVSTLSRYDLVIEDAEGQFWRVQVNFNMISSPCYTGRRSKGYKGECDYFGVYFEPTDGVYLVPIDEVKNTACTLRLEPTFQKGGKRSDTRMAYDYEL